LGFPIQTETVEDCHGRILKSNQPKPLKDIEVPMKTILVVSLLIAVASVSEPMPQAWRARQANSLNFVDRILSPEDNVGNPTKQVVELLAASAVPAARDAWELANRAAGGLDARDAVEVTGLYYVSTPELPMKLDLVWEVRTIRVPTVHRIVLVSATTRAVRVLYEGGK
jgi:hypothetical protein